MLKKIIMLRNLLPLLLFTVSCGAPNPYSTMDGWILRQNAIPRYFAEYDIFLIPPSLFEEGETDDPAWSKQKENERIYNFVHCQISEYFGRKVRFFVPQVHRLSRSEAGKILVSPPEEWESTEFSYAIHNTLESFKFYYKNYHCIKRPFIIIGYGQGAAAAYEMMKRMPEIRPENGFVAAYLPGFPGLRDDRIQEDFGDRGIRPARGAVDTGVILGWCVPGHTELGEVPPEPRRYVINPLSWKTDQIEVPASANPLSVLYDEFDPDPLARRLEVKNFCGAVIDRESGTLRISPAPGQKAAAAFIAKQKIRCNDTGLFLQSIVLNVNNRVARYRRELVWRKQAKKRPALPVSRQR